MSHVLTAIRTPKALAGFVLGCCLVFTSTGVQSATANSATLQWVANSETDLAGYRVYQGTTSGVYGLSVDVRNTTIYTAPNLQAGVRYYFAITAYDNSGNESLPSIEVSQQTSAPSFTLEIESVGDLDGDGKADIVWRNSDIGDVGGWQGNGVNAPTATGVIVGTLPATWVIAGTGDLNGDGKTDIVLRNTDDGSVGAWLGNGLRLGSTGVIAGAVPAAWVIVGVGDLDGDGKADIVWRNTDTGDVAVWQGNGANAPTTTGVIVGTLPAAWVIAGIGDLDGNGKADIVLRNTDTGDVAVWQGNGVNAPTTTGVIAEEVSAAWVIAGIGDLDGNGKADIVWRNTATGDVGVWLMNGLRLGSTGVIAGAVPAAWVIKGVGDLNGDGKADIVWLNRDDGSVGVWLGDGLTLGQTGVIAGVVALE